MEMVDWSSLQVVIKANSKTASSMELEATNLIISSLIRVTITTILDRVMENSAIQEVSLLIKDNSKMDSLMEKASFLAKMVPNSQAHGY